MSAKAQVTAQASVDNMPTGSGAITTPEKGTCHPGDTVKIEVSPATLDFGKVGSGGKVNKQITIKNTGDALLTLKAITLSTNPETSWSSNLPKKTALKKNETVTANVSFEAKKIGECKGKLDVESDAAEGPHEVELTAKVFGIKEPSPEKFLAPGADDEDYKILYTVEDPAGAVDEGELQILDAEKKNVIWSRALTADERKDGKHEIPWKGQITTKTGYPDGFLTVEFSPYTGRVVLKATGVTDLAQVDSVIKVEPHSLKIALGEKTHLKQDMDKVVFDQVTTDGGLPADGAKRKVYLSSNRFSTKGNDDHHDDDTSFKEHKNLWGGGAPLPLVATVWLKTSAAGVAESKTLAPLGVGDARVLWDFADVPEDTSALTSLPKSFVENALNWNKGSTEPPGDNCAGSATSTEDRGGKRADNGSTRPVLLVPSEHTDSERSAAKPLTDAYPYKAARGTTRRWSVLAEIVKTGADKGKCGIIFQGSRMAGDAFTVHAYFDVKRELDRKGGLPEFIKSNQPEKHPSDKTGTFEIWKELTILKLFSKNGNNTHQHSDIAPYYDKAYVRLVDKSSGTVTAFDETDYNTLFQTAINSKAEAYLKPHGIDDPAHQFGGTSALRVHPRATFENNYLDAKSTPALVSAEITANPGSYPQPVQADKEAAARTKLRTAAKNHLITKKYTHATASVADSRYFDKCQDYGADVAMIFCNDYMDATRVPGEGIAIFVFNWGASGWVAGHDGTRGMALYPPKSPNTTTKRGGYMQFATPPFYSHAYPGGSHNINRTVAHEIGHVVHLPHTRDESSAKDDYAHDWADRTCVMGYNYDSARHFCGYCLLRLRGWDHTKIKCGTDSSPRQNGSEPKIEVSAPTDQSSTELNKTAVQTFTIKNNGPAPLVLGTLALEGADKDQYEIKSGDDQASGQTIATGATKTVKLTFKPTSAGDKTVSLRIPSNDPAAPTVVTFTSKGQQPALNVTPANLDFELVLKGTTSAEKTLTLKNTGAPELTIEKIELVGTYAGDFEISSPAASTKLAKDATTEVKLKFKAQTTQPGDADWAKDAKLRIVSNEAASPRDTALKGTSFYPKLLILSPPPAFSNIWVGKESVHTTGLRSTTSSNLELKGIALDGADKAHFELRDLPANGKVAKGAQQTYKIVYKPTAAGSHSAQVKIDSNGVDNPHTVNLSGTAVNPPKVQVPATQAFPATKAGEESSLSITIQNTGGAELDITAVSGGTADFTVTGGTGKVAAGGSTTVDVKFKPGSAGAKTATLTVTSNDPNTPGATITLTGTGT